MSSFINHTVISDPELVDVVDEEWLQDTLPWDDVPLPEVPTNELAEDELQNAPPAPNEPERWMDLGLHDVR